jgi:hypothetical protein
MMRVTIITACYNRAATIGEAIESVAGQTYRDIEHIVVDGGSTDGTLDVVARHRSVARLIPGPDKGVYDALNKGIAAASGELIGFLHSDDVYAGNGVIERVAAEMKARALDALYGDVAFVRADDLDRVVRVYSSRRFRPSRIGWGWMPAHPGLFLRRKVFQDYGHSAPTTRSPATSSSWRDLLQAEFAPRVLAGDPGEDALGWNQHQGWRSTLTPTARLRACRSRTASLELLKILSKSRQAARVPGPVKVHVTGQSGFVGSVLVPALRSRGHEIVGSIALAQAVVHLRRSRIAGRRAGAGRVNAVAERLGRESAAAGAQFVFQLGEGAWRNVPGRAARDVRDRATRPVCGIQGTRGRRVARDRGLRLPCSARPWPLRSRRQRISSRS